jgi:SAM-dependent methyltransferase
MASLTSLVPGLRGPNGVTQRVLRSLPPRARTVVREHRRRLLRNVRGRVLDLTGDPDHRELYPVSAEVVAGNGEGPFDAVVSILHLAAVGDPLAELARIKALLAPEGALVFLEPVGDPGLGGRGQRLLGPAVRTMAGWRPDRDVVGLLREAGFVPVEMVRTQLPRYLWPLHGLVEGRARRRVATP